MKKKYPSNNEDTGMAKEPAVAVDYGKTTKCFKDIEDDIPVVIPSTWEEALDDIEQSEKDFAEGRCFAWDEVKQTIEDRIANYAD